MDNQDILPDFPALYDDINTCDFGCCSRYLECSDARSCISPDIGGRCMYRMNLDAGRIFYSRNSIYFDPSKYAEITSLVSGFSTGALDALDKVLSYICEYRLASSSCVIRNEYVDELSSLGVFEIKPLGSLFPEFCSSKSLFSLVQSSEPCLSAFQKVQAKRDAENDALPDGSKLPGSKTKEFLSSWLNAYGAAYRDEMAEPYRILYKRPEHTAHIEELFRDRFPLSRSDRMYSMSPLAADGLLLPSQIRAEEDRLAQWTKRHQRYDVFYMTVGRCRFLQAWPEWDLSVHESKEQISRQGRAMTYPFTFDVDASVRTARFSSTSDLPYYDTSLSRCDCYDFHTRHLPCKHMYRLAVELDVIEIIRRSGNDGKALLDEIKSCKDVDSHPEQIRRLESSKSVKIISIDYITQTARFSGSGKKPYETTLDSCTCRDFFVRGLPCKHIYRLRIELEKAHQT